MNTEILKRLDYDKLVQLKAAVEQEMASRMDFSILPGRTGYFIDRDGTKQFVRVDRVNPKSVSVKRLAGGPGGWRVSASMLVMDGVPKADRKPRAKSPTTSPAETYNVEAW